MLRSIWIGFLIGLLSSCHSSEKHINTPPPLEKLPKPKPIKKVEKTDMTFEYDHIELGSVNQGEKRDSAFVFTNTGTEDIIIDLVTACECTTLEYSTDPIKPAEQGRIDFVFDSTEKTEGERITIDILLKNTNPENGYPMVFQVTYDFEINEP